VAGAGSARGRQSTLLEFLLKSVGEAESREPRPGESRSVDVPRIGDFLLGFEPRDAREAPASYLMSVHYDGSRGSALVKLYDDREDKVYFWHDTTGHRSYFLADLPPSKVSEIRDVVGHPAFLRVSTVERMDLLEGRRRRLTKIVVRDPQAVRTLREKVPKAWEAHIKYHNNYVYDNKLIPGMRYRIVGGRLERVDPELSPELEEKVRSIFSGEDPETLKMALQWAPLFEEPPPRMRRVALDIEVYTPHRGRVPDPESAPYPVISIALAGSDGQKRVLMLARKNSGEYVSSGGPPSDVVVEFFDDERSLILEAFRVIEDYPLLLTFNGDNFDLNYLYHRALLLGIPPGKIPFHKTQDYITLRRGWHVDLYKFFQIRALQAYAFAGKYKEFTLDAIASALLGLGKILVEENISSLPPARLAAYNYRDAEITLKLTTFSGELVWKLMVLLMRISKLGLEEATRSQVSAWIRNLFYWEHRRRGYLIPLKEDIVALKGKTRSAAIIKGKKYAGAVVLDPPEGVFFNIVVLDFASLYPSIIKRWNLSYETVNPLRCPGGKLVEIPEVGHKVCMSTPGITAQITGLLRDFRVKMYKKRAKDKTLGSDERSWYQVVEKAMKVFINASYGVFGAESFPLYAPPLAESVTAIGRQVITETIRKAREMGLKVLYGDTDSLFLWHPRQELLEELREWVDREFGLELDVDKVYRYVTFSGKKKNYVGIYPDGSIEVKGMMGKKRNTPEFLKQAFREVLEELGSVEKPEDFEAVRDRIREKLRDVIKRLKRKGYTLDELAFHVMLTKPLEAYDKNTPEHVKAALYLKGSGREVVPGDIITYVKVNSRDGVKPIQLAKLVEIDVRKYEERVKSTFEQILSAINMSWEEITGSGGPRDLMAVLQASRTRS
jgi:DNA polymerase I